MELVAGGGKCRKGHIGASGSGASSLVILRAAPPRHDRRCCRTVGYRCAWNITEVEAGFRALKGEFGLGPILHQGDNQIRAHLSIAVLAWHAVHLIRTRLKMGGNSLSWVSIRNRLRNRVRMTTTIQKVGAGRITCRRDVLPSAEAAEIARRVGVKPGDYRCSNRRTG